MKKQLTKPSKMQRMLQRKSKSSWMRFKVLDKILLKNKSQIALVRTSQMTVVKVSQMKLSRSTFSIFSMKSKSGLIPLILNKILMKPQILSTNRSTFQMKAVRNMPKHIGKTSGESPMQQQDSTNKISSLDGILMKSKKNSTPFSLNSVQRRSPIKTTQIVKSSKQL